MDSVAKALRIMDENVINSYNINTSPYIAATPVNKPSYLMSRNVTDSSFKSPLIMR